MSGIGSQPSHIYENKLALWGVTACTMLGTLMTALDTTIANVALPYMQGSLAASRDQITWVLTSYIVASAIMTAPVGWIASRFGRKNYVLVSMAGFTAASMLCGAAQNLDQIIIFRLLQGAFGTALAPLAQSILLDLYPLEKRPSLMAVWGMGVTLGPILGPTLGGYLTDAYSWRWVFYVNLPIGIAAILGIWFWFRDMPRDVSLRFDWTGFLMLCIGIGAFQLLLDRGSTKDWFGSNEIIIEAVISAVGVYLFLVHLFTTDRTLIPKGVFSDRNFVSGLFVMFTISLVILASSALLPPYLQDLGGYSTLDTGLLMGPRGIGTMTSMLLVARIVRFVDTRYIMATGTMLMLWSMWEMSRWTPDVSAWVLATTTLTQGIGSGMVFVPMNLTAFATLSPHFRTDAASVYSLVRNMGSAIGVSITTTYLATATQTVHAQLAAHANMFNRGLTENAPSMYWNLRMPAGAAAFDSIIQRNALSIAYSNDFLFMLLISLPTLLVILMMRKATLIPKIHEFEIVE